MLETDSFQTFNPNSLANAKFSLKLNPQNPERSIISVDYYFGTSEKYQLTISQSDLTYDIKFVLRNLKGLYEYLRSVHAQSNFTMCQMVKDTLAIVYSLQAFNHQRVIRQQFKSTAVSDQVLWKSQLKNHLDKFHNKLSNQISQQVNEKIKKNLGEQKQQNMMKIYSLQKKVARELSAMKQKLELVVDMVSRKISQRQEDSGQKQNDEEQQNEPAPTTRHRGRYKEPISQDQRILRNAQQRQRRATRSFQQFQKTKQIQKPQISEPAYVNPFEGRYYYRMQWSKSLRRNVRVRVYVNQQKAMNALKINSRAKKSRTQMISQQSPAKKIQQWQKQYQQLNQQKNSDQSLQQKDHSPAVPLINRRNLNYVFGSGLANNQNFRVNKAGRKPKRQNQKTDSMQNHDGDRIKAGRPKKVVRGIAHVRRSQASRSPQRKNQKLSSKKSNSKNHSIRNKSPSVAVAQSSSKSRKVNSPSQSKQNKSRGRKRDSNSKQINNQRNNSRSLSRNKAVDQREKFQVENNQHKSRQNIQKEPRQAARQRSRDQIIKQKQPNTSHPAVYSPSKMQQEQAEQQEIKRQNDSDAKIDAEDQVLDVQDQIIDEFPSFNAVNESKNVQSNSQSTKNLNARSSFAINSHASSSGPYKRLFYGKAPKEHKIIDLQDENEYEKLINSYLGHNFSGSYKASQEPIQIKIEEEIKKPSQTTKKQTKPKSKPTTAVRQKDLTSYLTKGPQEIRFAQIQKKPNKIVEQSNSQSQISEQQSHQMLDTLEKQLQELKKRNKQFEKMKKSKQYDSRIDISKIVNPNTPFHIFKINKGQNQVRANGHRKFSNEMNLGQFSGISNANISTLNQMIDPENPPQVTDIPPAVVPSYEFLYNFKHVIPDFYTKLEIVRPQNTQGVFKYFRFGEGKKKITKQCLNSKRSRKQYVSLVSAQAFPYSGKYFWSMRILKSQNYHICIGIVDMPSQIKVNQIPKNCDALYVLDGGLHDQIGGDKKQNNWRVKQGMPVNVLEMDLNMEKGELYVIMKVDMDKEEVEFYYNDRFISRTTFSTYCRRNKKRVHPYLAMKSEDDCVQIV